MRATVAIRNLWIVYSPWPKWNGNMRNIFVPKFLDMSWDAGFRYGKLHQRKRISVLPMQQKGACHRGFANSLAKIGLDMTYAFMYA